MTEKTKPIVAIASDEACFVCGQQNPIGLKAFFSVDPERNRARAELTIADSYQGWQGIVHGGIIAALLDETAIYACRPISHNVVTAELNLKYKKPVPVDTPVVLLGEVEAVRRRIVFVSSRIEAAGELLAEAQVKVMLLDRLE